MRPSAAASARASDARRDQSERQGERANLNVHLLLN
jgi:hypothetical protein